MELTRRNFLTTAGLGLAGLVIESSPVRAIIPPGVPEDEMGAQLKTLLERSWMELPNDKATFPYFQRRPWGLVATYGDTSGRLSLFAYTHQESHLGRHSKAPAGANVMDYGLSERQMAVNFEFKAVSPMSIDDARPLIPGMSMTVDDSGTLIVPKTDNRYFFVGFNPLVQNPATTDPATFYSRQGKMAVSNEQNGTVTGQLELPSKTSRGRGAGSLIATPDYIAEGNLDSHQVHIMNVLARLTRAEAYTGAFWHPTRMAIYPALDDGDLANGIYRFIADVWPVNTNLRSDLGMTRTLFRVKYAPEGGFYKFQNLTGATTEDLTAMRLDDTLPAPDVNVRTIVRAPPNVKTNQLYPVDGNSSVRSVLYNSNGSTSTISDIDWRHPNGLLPDRDNPAIAGTLLRDHPWLSETPRN